MEMSCCAPSMAYLWEQSCSKNAPIWQLLLSHGWLVFLSIRKCNKIQWRKDWVGQFLIRDKANIFSKHKKKQTQKLPFTSSLEITTRPLFQKLLCILRKNYDLYYTGSYTRQGEYSFYNLLKCYFACKNRNKLTDFSKHSQNAPSSDLHNLYFLGRKQKRVRIGSNSLKNL